MSSSKHTPRETAGRMVLSVSQLTDAVKSALQSQFSGIWVAGEITDISRPASGHLYFSLKDSEARLSAAMWRPSVSRLKCDLQDGMEVLCFGGIDIYPPRGTYQLIVRNVELRGEGALQRALRQLQERLSTEGLFDPRRKRPLPRFPRRVAVITSPTGAAIRDFLEVARRRWTDAELVVLPIRVQGASSAGEAVAALETANLSSLDFDVIVLTRGGGSMEDLWGFNHEELVRAIFASRVPVVSAIGHEIDVTLCDLVADVRALTPSEAAERVLPSMEEVYQTLQHLRERMEHRIVGGLEHGRTRVDALANRRVFAEPTERLRLLAQRLDDLDGRANLAVEHQIEKSRQWLARFGSQLESLSPLSVLARGYSLTLDGAGKTVRSADEVSLGDTLTTQLARGELSVHVVERRVDS